MIIDLAIRGCDVLVVGGGGVATRRVEALLAEGARVTVLAPQLSPSLTTACAAGALRHLQGRWDLQGALPAGDWRLLVVAVDDVAVDRDLLAAAQAAGLPASSALGGGDVRHLAVRRHGPLSLAVDTGGASPGLAAALADRLLAVLQAEVSADRLDEWQRIGWPRRPEEVAAAFAGGRS